MSDKLFKIDWSESSIKEHSAAEILNNPEADIKDIGDHYRVEVPNLVLDPMWREGEENIFAEKYINVSIAEYYYKDYEIPRRILLDNLRRQVQPLNEAISLLEDGRHETQKENH